MLARTKVMASSPAKDRSPQTAIAAATMPPPKAMASISGRRPNRSDM